MFVHVCSVLLIYSIVNPVSGAYSQESAYKLAAYVTPKTFLKSHILIHERKINEEVVMWTNLWRVCHILGATVVKPMTNLSIHLMQMVVGSINTIFSVAWGP